MLWTAVYFAVFEWLGYIISTAVYLIVLTAYFNRGKWIANILTSVLFGIGGYVMFSKLLDVNASPRHPAVLKEIDAWIL